MKIFTLMSAIDYEGSTLVGIYSSLERAQEVCMQDEACDFVRFYVVESNLNDTTWGSGAVPAVYHRLDKDGSVKKD